MNYSSDIIQATLDNENYRYVYSTTKYNQIVLMSLNPYEDIGMEKHNATQFIFIVSGDGMAIINGKEIFLRDGICLNIPPGINHNIIAHSYLKLFAIYSPPQHAYNTVQRTKE